MCNFDDIHERQKASVLYCDIRNLVDLMFMMFIILRQATEPNVWLRYRAAFRKWEHEPTFAFTKQSVCIPLSVLPYCEKVS